MLEAGEDVGEGNPVVFCSVQPVEPPDWPPRMLPTTWAPCE